MNDNNCRPSQLKVLFRQNSKWSVLFRQNFQCKFVVVDVPLKQLFRSTVLSSSIIVHQETFRPVTSPSAHFTIFSHSIKTLPFPHNILNHTRICVELSRLFDKFRLKMTSSESLFCEYKKNFPSKRGFNFLAF